jgi:hypothetical protein
MFHVPEQYRDIYSFPGNDASLGNNGYFLVENGPSGRFLSVIASDGCEWEHVSAKAMYKPGRFKVPNWEEMCYLKTLFWDPEDVVMQLHPKQSEYVNNHPSVLHLWRPVGLPIPQPPPILVGVQ